MDLNLNQIIESICRLWGEDITSLYYLPADVESEQYRREIFEDVKKEEIYSALSDFVKEMTNYKQTSINKEVVTVAMQKAAWHVQEIVEYGTALEKLHSLLQKENITSNGMKLLCEYLQEYLQKDDFQEMYTQAKALADEMDGFRIRLIYENNMLKIEEGEAEGNYDIFLRNCFPDVEKNLKNPFGDTPAFTPVEREVLKVFATKKPDFFKKYENFHKKYQGYAEPRLLILAQELPYYLAYYKFERRMRDYGFAFTVPTICEEQQMYATGLYDLALACVNCKDGKEVISNDMEYREGERFFVVTGPNQGGKTTFARSLGQLIFFSKMGLDVPALSANVHTFLHILTHFSVEESVETGRGKLQEELRRLQPMMSADEEGSFVIINELFTTAANYDACIMGQRVLQHFISQKCMGIYVTHLAELTQAHESVVSMCATLDEQGKQTHRVVRKKAGDVACAINQVKKYRLNYEQIKERLV